MAWQTPFSEKEDQFIRRNWPELGTAGTARALGRSKSGVKGRVAALGLRDGQAAMPARVTAARKGAPRTLREVAAQGDEKETLEALRDVLAQRIMETDSARDTAALAKRMIEVGERIAEVRDAGKAENPGKQGAGVTSFDVIARRNAGRRAASQG